ncbi:hypothetical protein HMPREF1502_0085 [Klebsiella sp. AS10]|uniref:hypothetical protein n=1 Tax=Klebsiella sp. AS10 TaxID=936564 RepID=UPI00044F2912|nr:hypothetical protein [Klebsiella sp. AS10]EBS9685304.1 hypothetical protein [Salmonella enterica]EJC9534128.1 hypothetical protein [Salmonella enterica]EJE8360579.1 hypothetical protein [Salmonella enterica]EKQ5512724.1 hypothetical protein [Salmonella enterica]EUB39472.1 hypothetical protein HMPREF1502_0085 [Klebsiella sp. AS10]
MEIFLCVISLIVLLCLIINLYIDDRDFTLLKINDPEYLEQRKLYEEDLRLKQQRRKLWGLLK